ncbi:flagellar basal-body rod modification protein FlgD [Cohaesibacter marisflavi]|uniref:Basal-body rod modification protein FlgD n=1 Tax=Cohaesibacter marisflavi TaxID=655353 RepID=A0A1I5C921_9HYPH|nr:flagellar hook assembly protein FlgD [Cohaesibacter marisflavi]SFN83457.1 flagellar basal-body rod modification protein FlgD [Cohaesibacter marisflavi]
MSVSPVTSSTSAASTQSSSSVSSAMTLDYDAFLQMMVTQMQYQDPTNPTDMSEQMGQLASFSNVEQNIQTNNKLDNVLSQLYVNQSTSLVGKTLSATRNGSEISGTIASVTIATDGVVASLDDGTNVLVGPGVTIS